MKTTISFFFFEDYLNILCYPNSRQGGGRQVDPGADRAAGGQRGAEEDAEAGVRHQQEEGGH